MSGYYGFGNAGDESVLAGIIAGLRARCGRGLDIVVHSIDPDATSKLHGVSAVHRYKVTDVLGSLRGADLVVSGGGSLLQDVTSARSILYYLGILRLARLFRRKRMIYAQGIGPIRGRINRMLTRIELNRVDAITVRDDESREVLLGLGVRVPKIRVTADPSFAVEPASDDIASAALAAAGAKEGVDLLGVSLRSWTSQDRWLPEVADGIRDAAVEIGAQPLFLPMQPSMDQEVVVNAADRVRTLSAVASGIASPALAKALSGRVGVMVAMRLHALIFAASMGVPGVAISYDPKVKEFARIAGMRVLDVESVNASELKEAILATWERRQELGEAAARSASSFRDSAISNADVACELLS